MAMNPCPCGNATDPARTCTCTPADIQRYLSRVSGPLLDRIDLHIEVPAVRYQDLASSRAGESSAAIRERVARAREMQARRFSSLKGVYANAGIQGEQIRRYCRLDAAGEELLKTAMSRLGLSARAYDRILKVSRTIADLAVCETIRPEHVGEAIQYRSLDRERFG
jgi:magnesium chelatase family protein